MRIYIPLTPEALVKSQLPMANAVPLPAPSGPMTGEEQDLLSEEALYEAAFTSLELCQESGEEPCRIVAVAEVRDLTDPALPWEQVDSIMADSLKGRELAQQAFQCDNQIALDRLVEELFETPLSWFDVSERFAVSDEIAGSQ